MSKLTVYRDLEQRSDEWYAARCGIVTASAVGSLVTASPPGADAYACPECLTKPGQPCLSLRDGKPLKNYHPARTTVAAHHAPTATPILTVADTDTSRGLLTTLAAERITGHVEETPITSDMWRGIEHEPFARDYYAEHHAPVTEVGFMVRDFGGYRLGYSPDGLVGKDGLIEIKAPRAKSHIAAIVADEVPAKYVAQLQAGLLVSGRKWVDFIPFVAGLPLWTKRVTPDPAWQSAITQAAQRAEQTITDITDRYLAATEGLPGTDRIDLEIKVA